MSAAQSSAPATIIDEHQFGSATFSEDRRHRFRLTRRITENVCATRAVLFVMLNPSTADAFANDPTVRRCIGYATAWGFDALRVGNIFSLRSTDPRALYADPADATGGEENDRSILEMAKGASLVVCAWGVHGALARRGERIGAMLRDARVMPFVLGETKKGHPMHPLYLKADLKPIRWER